MWSHTLSKFSSGVSGLALEEKLFFFKSFSLRVALDGDYVEDTTLGLTAHIKFEQKNQTATEAVIFYYPLKQENWVALAKDLLKAFQNEMHCTKPFCKLQVDTLKVYLKQENNWNSNFVFLPQGHWQSRKVCLMMNLVLKAHIR